MQCPPANKLLYAPVMVSSKLVGSAAANAVPRPAHLSALLLTALGTSVCSSDGVLNMGGQRCTEAAAQTAAEAALRCTAGAGTAEQGGTEGGTAEGMVRSRQLGEAQSSGGCRGDLLRTAWGGLHRRGQLVGRSLHGRRPQEGVSLNSTKQHASTACKHALWPSFGQFEPVHTHRGGGPATDCEGGAPYG